MRVPSWFSPFRWLLLGGVLVVDLVAAGATRPAPQVVVLRDAGWSQGDMAREGAAEFMVLMQVARLQQAGPGGLVAVGDRRGRFSGAAETALVAAVLRGIPVVKVVPPGGGVANPDGLFLDGGALSPEAAQEVLARCLAKYGTWPAGAEATPRMREQLQRFQNELTLARGQRLAVR